MKTSRLIAFVLFGGFYALGNIGGNYVGWEVIFKWFEQANGPNATISPVWFNPFVFFALAILASVGQWWREWFGVEDKWKWIIYVVMAADLGINAIGFYYLAMGTFSFPPVWPVFIFLSAFAFIPNVLCQSIATLNLKELLKDDATPDERVASSAAKAKARLQVDASPTQRRTNGAIPAKVEELTL